MLGFATPTLTGMKPMVAPTYTAPVSASLEALSRLEREMLDDLDVERYGFGWWHGHVEVKRIAIMSDYLVGSVSGTQLAIADASYALSEYTQQVFAHDKWQQQQIAALGPRRDDASVLAALRLDSAAEKRERRIRLHREHFFYHVAQTLDRMAAIVIGVGALKMDLVMADWMNLCRFTPKAGHQPADGYAEQVALLDLVRATVADAGPPDWLDWSLAQRNSRAHRAPKFGFVAMTRGSRKTSSRFISLLHRQPRWSDTEAFVARRKDDHIAGIYLLQDPAVVMTGILASLNDTCVAITEACTDLWLRRRANPALLVQRAALWPKLETAPLQFGGYGSDLDFVMTGAMRVSPDMGKRMKASGLFDSSDLWE